MPKASGRGRPAPPGGRTYTCSHPGMTAAPLGQGSDLILEFNPLTPYQC